MDKKYITLFKELAQATAASAETVMEYDREKGDEKGLETATSMRDDFQALADTIAQEGDSYSLARADVGKLLVAAMIMVNQLQTRMDNLKMSMTGYQSDLIPKLQKILDESKTDDESRELANATFILEDNE